MHQVALREAGQASRAAAAISDRGELRQFDVADEGAI